MRELRIITGNAGKFREIKTYLSGLGIELVQESGEFVEVQCDSLEEVVYHGLREYVRRNGEGTAFIKDDSGLFIDSLGGFPGVYSSYVQRTIGNEGILKLTSGMRDRNARFKTAIGLFEPGKGIGIFRGEVAGTITTEIRGRLGFGYDPIFVPNGEERSFAEMTSEDKNTMSHRIRALRSLLDHLGRTA